MKTKKSTCWLIWMGFVGKSIFHTMLPILFLLENMKKQLEHALFSAKVMPLPGFMKKRKQSKLQPSRSTQLPAFTRFLGSDYGQKKLRWKKIPLPNEVIVCEGLTNQMNRRSTMFNLFKINRRHYNIQAENQYDANGCLKLNIMMMALSQDSKLDW